MQLFPPKNTFIFSSKRKRICCLFFACVLSDTDHNLNFSLECKTNLLAWNFGSCLRMPRGVALPAALFTTGVNTNWTEETQNKRSNEFSLRSRWALHSQCAQTTSSKRPMWTRTVSPIYLYIYSVSCPICIHARRQQHWHFFDCSRCDTRSNNDWIENVLPEIFSFHSSMLILSLTVTKQSVNIIT